MWSPRRRLPPAAQRPTAPVLAVRAARPRQGPSPRRPTDAAPPVGGSRCGRGRARKLSNTSSSARREADLDLHLTSRGKRSGPRRRTRPPHGRCRAPVPAQEAGLVLHTWQQRRSCGRPRPGARGFPPRSHGRRPTRRGSCRRRPGETTAPPAPASCVARAALRVPLGGCAPRSRRSAPERAAPVAPDILGDLRVERNAEVEMQGLEIAAVRSTGWGQDEVADHGRRGQPSAARRAAITSVAAASACSGSPKRSRIQTNPRCSKASAEVNSAIEPTSHGVVGIRIVPLLAGIEPRRAP